MRQSAAKTLLLARIIGLPRIHERLEHFGRKRKLRVPADILVLTSALIAVAEPYYGGQVAPSGVFTQWAEVQ